MRSSSLIAALSMFVALLVGCTAQTSGAADAKEGDATHEAATVNTAAPAGTYQIKGSNDFVWVKLEAGRYGLWRSGSKCNKNVATAPASCTVTGKYTFNDDKTEITFTDDATNTDMTSDYHVDTVGFALDTSTTTQTTGAQKSNESDNSANTKSDKPVATAMNLSKCFQAAMLACQLMFPDPKLTGPETIPEIKIERPLGTKPTAQG
jgi:hypothetical protein